MIELGIIVYDRQQFEDIASKIGQYLQASPDFYNSYENLLYWTVPFLHITLMVYNPTERACRFEIIYYDERIPEDEIYTHIWRPLPKSLRSILPHMN